MSSYCAVAADHPWHGPYHDGEYGFPSNDETVLFERLALEIMQAGLSWLTVLKKRAALRQAFADFSVDRVAALAPDDMARLLENPGIIRNRLKIDAIVHNARKIQAMRASHNGFAGWLASQHPLRKEDWVRAFKRQFRFTGGEITGEFLMSLGYLPGTHRPDCPVRARIAALNPPWMQVPEGFW